LPDPVLPSFCSYMSSAVAQDGDVSMCLASQSSAQAGDLWSCPWTPELWSWPSQKPVLIPFALCGVTFCCGGLKVATSVSYKNNCGQGCICFKENGKLYPETTFWESIMGYKVNNPFSLQW